MWRYRFNIEPLYDTAGPSDIEEGPKNSWNVVSNHPCSRSTNILRGIWNFFLFNPLTYLVIKTLLHSALCRNPLIISQSPERRNGGLGSKPEEWRCQADASNHFKGRHFQPFKVQYPSRQVKQLALPPTSSWQGWTWIIISRSHPPPHW